MGQESLEQSEEDALKQQRTRLEAYRLQGLSFSSVEVA